MEPGFPRKISKDFPGVDSKVDAVFEAFGKRTCTRLAIGLLKCYERYRGGLNHF